MSVWQCMTASPLSGSEGELVSVSISVDPRDLEELLDALAHVDFPVNPQIYHSAGLAAGAKTVVEFPAYSGGLPQVRAAVMECGLEPEAIASRGMLEEIHGLLGQKSDRRDPQTT